MLRYLAPLLVVLLFVPTHTRAQQGEDYIQIEPTPELKVFRSKHYRIYTPLTRAEVVPYGRHIDAMHEQYLKRFSGLNGKLIQPMPVYLFRTEQQYNRFLAEHDIDATHSGGMFFVTHKLEGLATWVHRDNKRKTFEVLQHEGFHQFAWHTFGPRLPVWLNEGLAQYFEDAVLADGRMSLGMADGTRIRKMRIALKQGNARSMDSLLNLSAERWSATLRKDPNHASLIYAQAWSIAYFLIHGDDEAYKSKLLDYLERIGGGDRPEDAEFMAFGKGGIESLDRAWRDYALKQQPDQVTEASERLRFLGTGLRVLAEQGEDMPQDMQALRDILQRRGFRLSRSEMGVTQDFSAQQSELYSYRRGNSGKRDFVLLRPDKTGLPPRLAAPGLDPEPTLIWYRDDNGKLVQEIEYR